MAARMNSSSSSKDSSLPMFSVEKSHDVSCRGVITDEVVEEFGEVQRGLKSRHIQLIALGGTIGTGLFVGSAKALATAGPFSALLAYAFIALCVFCVMQSLGEMISYLPLPGAVPSLASRYIDESWQFSPQQKHGTDSSRGFAQGWLYWLYFGVSVAVEITAAALIITYWDAERKIPVGIYISVLYVMIIGVQVYGEMEFWFASLKIVTIVGLLLMSFIVVLGGNPKHERLGFRYWKDPGYMREYLTIGDIGRLCGLWKVMLQAAFSYSGTELIAITAGEARNPRRNVPKAVRRVFWRIIIFYVFGVLAIGVLVPYNDPYMSKQIANGVPGASASPFVIGISRVGIDVLPHIINAVILSSAWSSGNSFAYAGSRTIYSLALDGKAPSIFKTCTKNGIPIFGVGSIAIVGLSAFLNIGNSSSQVFDWLANLCTIANIITWNTILLAFIRFKKGLSTQGISRNSLPFKSIFQPFGLFWISMIIIFNGFDTFQSGFSLSQFLPAYLSLIFFAVFYVGHKITSRSKFVRDEDMDFITGQEKIDREEAMHVENIPTTWYERFWDWLV
ncbi:putative proline-specific permease put4 [Neolecta irregularis DAH-3]|uniref:Putative proline-specific permease put4 n=1 Tax=Neolecta irregularis (strain DAH-3) TaxID=1198029 RepID=A0A1U7LH20_NEOID|nr:putative proline-specific permease put4 [Neolecta irregularis DAH-3]|eukprot:OLL21893.1 putative proline-specific permease put4 [Neolecta irregularis DAH-3]